MRNKEKKEV